MKTVNEYVEEYRNLVNNLSSETPDKIQKFWNNLESTQDEEFVDEVWDKVGEDL